MSGGAAEASTDVAQSVLTQILNAGLPSSASTSRPIVAEAAGPSAEEHYISRVKGRRVQLINPDRQRDGADDAQSSAAASRAKRDKRVLKEAARRSGLKTKGVTGQVMSTSSSGDPSAPLGRRELKAKGLRSLDSDITSATLAPIQDLWVAYIQRMLVLIDEHDRVNHSVLKVDAATPSCWTLQPAAVGTMQAAICKADLCGAQVRVLRASNPALVGLNGTVISETEGTVALALRPVPSRTAPAPSNRCPTRIVPKRNAVFVVSVPLPNIPNSTSSSPGCIEFPVHGNQLRYNVAVRTTRKSKYKKTTEF